MKTLPFVIFLLFTLIKLTAQENVDEVTIRLFESGDTLPAYSSRKYQDVFVDTETRYINTEIYVKNLLFEKNAQSLDIKWQWEDTIPLVKGETKSKMEISSEWKYAYSSNGWGSKIPGSWRVGKYYAVVYIKNKLVGSKVFYVVPRAYKGQEMTGILMQKIDAEYNFQIGKGFLSTATPQLAIPFLSIAAGKGSGMAQYYLGIFYTEGQYVPRDSKLAIEWLLKAAYNGVVQSFYSLGYQYTLVALENNEDNLLNYGENSRNSYYWLHMYSFYADPNDTSFNTFLSASKGVLSASDVKGLDDKAYTYLTDLYTRKYKEKEYTIAREILLPIALSDDGWSQYCMAQLHQWGLGTVKNDSTALYWYERAASNNYANAFDQIGSYYYSGTVKPRDVEKAIEYYKKGVDLGSGEAMNKLAWLYYDGKDVKQDYAEAFRLFLKGADTQHDNDQLMAGFMYEMGYGTEKNMTMAVSLYNMSAEKGNSVAQFNLGLCYEYGKGTAVNDDKAIYWYSRAGQQGHVQAQYDLGELYEKKGQLQDALYWYGRSSQSGYTLATDALNRLKK